MKARVLGAGVAGLCVAAELVARDCEVTVFDPAPRPGPLPFQGGKRGDF